jgi:hypothetical protein
MNGAGKVTPDSVAPNEPTIDTILIIMLMAGNRENRKTPKACVAIMKRIIDRFRFKK